MFLICSYHHLYNLEQWMYILKKKKTDVPMAIRFYLGSQDNQVEFVLTNPLYPMPIDFNHANSCKEGCPLLALTCPWGWSLNLFVDELHDNWNPWGAPQEFHLQLRCQCFGRLSFEWHLLPGFPKPCRDARCHQQDCFLFFWVYATCLGLTKHET